MIKIMALGEVMLELSPVAGGDARLRHLGVAGDTYNTAVYLARLGVPTGYFTRVGDDPYSEQMLSMMRSEGLNTASVTSVPGRVPGLYMIANNDAGERTFHYWRGESPARDLFASDVDMAAFQAAVSHCEWLYFSGISLGIISDDAKKRLCEALALFRAQGGKVAFDSNYRPRLWRDRDHVREAMSSALAVTDLALLTDEDEMALWEDDSEAPILARCALAGVQEVVVKRGPKSVWVASGLLENGCYVDQKEVPITPVQPVVDTTAAGDSFNAGFLASRLKGRDLTAAVRCGAQCAGIVIQHRGAIVEKNLVTPSMV